MLMKFCKDCWRVISVDHDCSHTRIVFDAILKPGFFDDGAAVVSSMFVNIDEEE